jgi:hypothetical protein
MPCSSWIISPMEMFPGSDHCKVTQNACRDEHDIKGAPSNNRQTVRPNLQRASHLVLSLKVELSASTISVLAR